MKKSVELNSGELMEFDKVGRPKGLYIRYMELRMKVRALFTVCCCEYEP
jgi:hypothetical protein